MTTIHYILESRTAILDDEGEALQEFSYDAWGNSRDPYTWTGTNANRCMFDRGFTGHEMLYDFGLINMNGRCYDPVMSSFLSVDRYVQNPSNSQSFNRYSYCLNNPLKYTDPSGWQMSDPYTPYAPVWGLGCHVGLEPRDFRDGSAFMTSWTLFGGGDGSLSAGGGGGGSSTVSYGFAVNNPQYTVEQQCSLIRNWQKNPSWINKWMMQKAGLSDINRGEVYVNGIRNTYLSWEYNGVSHTASVENEYVGGRGLWCQTVSDIGGRGSYMPPGYKGVMPAGTTNFVYDIGDWCNRNQNHITTFSVQNSLVNGATTMTINSVKAVAPIEKEAMAALRGVKAGTGVVGYVGVAADIFINGIDAYNGKMSWWEFGVRTVGDFGVLALCSAYPVAGLVVGTVNALGGFDWLCDKF